MRAFLLLSATLVACTAGSYEGAVFRRGDLAYKTGGLSPAWKRIRVEDANLAFKHPGGGAIIANAICGEAMIDDVPLDVLLNQSLFGVSDIHETEREEMNLDSRAALRAHITGAMDGVPIELELVVLKKDNCTFDFQLVAGPEEFEERRPDFQQFYKAFRKIVEAKR